MLSFAGQVTMDEQRITIARPFIGEASYRSSHPEAAASAKLSVHQRFYGVLLNLWSHKPRNAEWRDALA